MERLSEGSQERMAEKAAACIISKAFQAIGDKGWCSLVLSGGSSPRRLYEKLAEGLSLDVMASYNHTRNTGEGNTIRLPWKKIMLFWGDERCVPDNHPDSNLRMAREHLLDRTAIPSENIFSIPHVTAGFSEAALCYETTLRRFFRSHRSELHPPCPWPVFDIVLLGMGPDGHTASLFPDDTRALEEKRRWAIDVYAPQGSPPGHRITMTLPVINNAENVFFYITGAPKTALARHIISGRHSELPAARINPLEGELHWFLGED